jgi:very-short-patch-repair endonuclease
MKPLVRATVDAYLAGHHGVISRDRAVSLGLTPKQIRVEVDSRRWQRLYRGVYLAGSHPKDPLARLAGACLAAGVDSAASHRSAAWLWSLTPTPPPHPEITLAGGRKSRPEMVIRRRRDLDLERIVVHRGIPVTDPLRTLVDLAEVADAGDLDDAVDRALAGKLLTVTGLEAEIERLGQRGRRGVRALREALKRRGLVQAPTASVLESRVLRLLRQWRISPIGVEVVVADGRYRIDVMLAPGLALEVDGYAFHWSPEAKAADSQRRNRLALQGIRVVEADWVTVMRHPDQLREAIELALRQVLTANRRVAAGE